MNFELIMPNLYFTENLPRFDLNQGITSDYFLPIISESEGYELKGIILEADEIELGEYFAIKDNPHRISYVPPRICSSTIKSFSELKLI